MSLITIPSNLQPAFRVSERSQVCDENGNLLGYYTPAHGVTDEDLEWVSKQMTPELVEAALAGPFRPASEIIPELRRKYGS